MLKGLEEPVLFASLYVDLIQATWETLFVVRDLRCTCCLLNGLISHSNEYSGWIGDSLTEDANQTIAILQHTGVDCLVVDHYGLDQQWESEVSNFTHTIVVIDDLANRNHHCDVLLDQTLNRSVQDYKTRTPHNCIILCGTEYALIRPEFKKLRTSSLAQRKPAYIKNTLIFLGGSDPDNFNRRIIKSINSSHWSGKLAITLVLGYQSPWKQDLQSLCKSLTLDVRILSNISNMAEVLLDSDICIGAAGSSVWERACLGVPTVLLTIAENQKFSAQQLSALSASISISSPDQITVALDELSKRYSEISSNSAMLVDGKGCDRVLETVLRITDQAPARAIA